MKNSAPTSTRQPLVFGLPFSQVTAAGALDRCLDIVKLGQSRHVITANVDFLARAESDASIRRLMFEADEVFCDGMPLVWASRWFGKSESALPERVTGSDLVPALLKRCAAEGRSVFFLGSDEPTLVRLEEKLGDDLPELRIAGAISPPMGAIEDWDNEGYVEVIREAKPDVLLVAVGFPKQDQWIRQFRDRIQVPLMIGVGASLDFIAAKQVRAPRWMQRSGLEWAWRLGTDPKRLARRYAKDARVLAGALARQIRFSLMSLVPVWKGRRVEDQGMLNGVRLERSCEVLRWEPGEGVVREGVEGAAVTVFDLTGVEAPDPELLEAIVDCGREAMQGGGRFAIFGAGRRVRAWLKAFGIGDQLWAMFDSPRAVAAWAGGVPLPGRRLDSSIRARAFDQAAAEVTNGYAVALGGVEPIRIDMGGESGLTRASARRFSDFMAGMESLGYRVGFVNLDERSLDALEIFDLAPRAAA